MGYLEANNSDTMPDCDLADGCGCDTSTQHKVRKWFTPRYTTEGGDSYLCNV